MFVIHLAGVYPLTLELNSLNHIFLDGSTQQKLKKIMFQVALGKFLNNCLNSLTDILFFSFNTD